MGNSTPKNDELVTSFLLVNLHCPSCVSHIEDALYSLSPRPTSVSPSIVSNWVTVHHNSKLPADAIHNALEEIGFEVSDVTPNRSSILSSSAQSHRRTGSSWASESYLDRVMEDWRSVSHNKLARDMEREKRERHVKNCKMCQDKPNGVGDRKHSDLGISQTASTSPAPVRSYQNGHVRSDSQSTSSPKKKRFGKLPWQKQPPISPPAFSSAESNIIPEVVVEPSAATDEWRATFAIGGMTCASCSNAITKALQGKSWVKRASVNLVGNNATIEFYGKGRETELIEAIEEIGYEATLDQITDLHKASSNDVGEDEWRLTVAVGGMTCASCANSIKRGLEKRDWIKEVVVNLVGNSATIVFKGKGREGEVIETIEELGYDASQDSLENLNTLKDENPRRTVEIKVDGMFCDHCPAKVLNAVSKFEDRITIEKPISISDPILTISYVPQAPEFTIRNILSAIQQADISFETSIYHPPTLEERSSMIHAAEQRRLLRRVILTLVVAIPTFIIGIIFMSLVQKGRVRDYMMMSLAGVSRAQWALFIMSTPIFFFAADVFHTRAIKEVQSMWRRGSKTPILQRFYRFGSMNMLMSLGTSIAYISSVAQLIAGVKNKPKEINDSAFYFDSVVFLTMFLLIGRLLESYSKTRTGDAVTMLGKLRPNEAILLDAGRGKATAVDQLEFNDTIRVVHGGSPPADGVIVDGETSFDESSLTGESRPVRKNVGDQVFAGTINTDGAVTVRITGIGGGSMLDQIVAAVREGQTKRAPIERIADALTSYFVPVVTLLAIVTWIIWMSLGLSGRLPKDYLDVESGGWPAWSLQFAIALFVVACPCGLALAAPTALFVGGGLAAKYGILVKGGGEAFEKSSRLDCIVFDKTGTLTVGGEPTVTDHMFTSNFNEDQILSMVKTVEGSSSHTVAKAIVTFCAAKNIEGLTAIDTRETPGHGIRGTFSMEGDKTITSVIIGNEAMMQGTGLSIAAEDKKVLDTWKKQGKSVALVAIHTGEAGGNGSGSSSRASSSKSSKPVKPYTLALMLAVSDPIRPETHDIVEALESRGIEVWMLSGDNELTAKAIGAMAGISEYRVIAGVLPSEKADVIKNLQSSLKPQRHNSTDYSRRAIIAMVGDGINDSPALTTADIGIAIGSGSDIAISSAEFVLVNSNLNTLLTLLDLSRFVFNRIKLNFAWAFLYNLIALPVAAGVLYPIKSHGTHVRLDPVWASLAMALSSISVVCSSLALRSRIPYVGFRPRKTFGGEEVRVEREGALKL